MDRILIAEDNPAIRLGLKNTIPWEKHGITVVADVDNGRAALDYLDGLDVIISDIVMPGMNGIELAQAVRESHPEIMLVFISAHTEFNYAQNAIDFGVYSYVTKPIDNTKLLNAVLGALAEKKKERRLHEQLEKSLPLLREKLFLGLIMDDVSPEAFARDYEFFGLKFDSPQYTCMIFEYAPSGVPDVRSLHLYSLGLMEEMKSSFPEEMNMVFSNAGSRVIMISKENFAQARVKTKFYDAFERLIAQAREKSIVLTIGVGEPVYTAGGIRASFQKAQGALEAKFYYGEGRIYNAQDATVINAGGFSVDEEKILKKIMLEVRFGDKSALEGLFGEMDRETSEVSMTRDRLKLLALMCCTELMLFVGENAEMKGIFYDRLSRMISNIDSFATKGELLLALSGAAIAISGYINDLNSLKNNNLVENIKKFVQGNYMNASLTVNLIAGKMFLSPGYIGVVFKKKTGQSLLEYITAVRIGRAQDLLLTTDMKIYEVSKAVGYDDSFYFSKCYKKVAGCSPNDARRRVTSGQ